MKIQVVTPFEMQWIDGYKEVFKDHDVSVTKTPEEGSDVMLFMWCDNNTKKFINENEKKAKYIVFLRRYELYSFNQTDMHWSKIDHMIFVNDFFRYAVSNMLNNGNMPNNSVIYNGVLPYRWSFKERTHGNKIAMVCYINKKKNIPLALQVMAELPEPYELHIAGAIQEAEVMDYISNITPALRRRVYINGRVDNINLWLEDKNYLLNCAISEGCPNNVIEAMAKGIKPIVHNYPGAKEQFGDSVFNTIDKVVSMINPGSPYNSMEYRETVEYKFGLKNYEQVRTIVESCVKA